MSDREIMNAKLGLDSDEAKTAVEILEEEYPVIYHEYLNIQDELLETFARKMLDYGIGNIALGTTLEEEKDKHLSLTGIWLRCNDKINRLRNLLTSKEGPYVNDESLSDSFQDMSNYGIIAEIVNRGKWKK